MTTTTADGRLIEISRDLERRRYTAAVDGEVIGEAEFMLTSDVIVFTHTEVSPAYGGQGIAGALVRWALEDSRAHGYRVVASCPYVKRFIAQHAGEFGDLTGPPPTP